MSDWQFELEDLEDDNADGSENDEAARRRIANAPIEPGNPSPENAAFVLLGVAAAVYVLLQVLG